MIDFRYHLVSLVAVFLALALGIVLGSTALADPVASTLGGQTERLQRSNQELRDQIQTLETAADYTDGFVTAISPALLQGRLEGERVVIVLLPEADPAAAESLSARLTEAGTQISGQVTISDAYVDPDQDQVLDDLVARVVPAGVTLSGDDAYDRAAAELGAVLTTSDPAQAGQELPGGQTVLSAFEAAGFLTTSGEVLQRATAAVLLGGPPPTQEDATAAPGSAEGISGLVSLAAGLDAASRGAVLAAPPAAATADGVIGALRANDDVRRTVSSVDVLGTAAGDVTVALATEAEVQGVTGQYGVADSADAPAPTPAPTPS